MFKYKYNKYIMDLPLSYKDFNLLEKNSYTIKQLQMIGEKFKIKWKNKIKLKIKEECYLFLKRNYYCVLIQKQWRKYFINLFNKTQGPALFNRRICNNMEDFLTTENTCEIDYYYFISFKDSDTFIYGFNVISIHNLIVRNMKYNPYTRNPFTEELIKNVITRMRYNFILNKTRHSLLVEKPNFTIDQKIGTLFQKMDFLGNYTQIEWFTRLDETKIKKFILELHDIWNYRAQLTPEIKLLICPITANPFTSIPMFMIEYNTIDITLLKQYSYHVMCELLNKAVLEEHQSLGAYYILTALTLVSESAAEAMPWLYNSVI